MASSKGLKKYKNKNKNKNKNQLILPLVNNTC